MGIHWLDVHSIEHFLMGLFSYFLVNRLHFSLTSNFILCNGIHLVIETIEHNVSPQGEILETTRNHLSDVLFFFLGWILAYHIEIENYIAPVYIPFLWITLILIIIQEVLRELWPQLNIPFWVKGAFISNKKQNRKEISSLNI